VTDFFWTGEERKVRRYVLVPAIGNRFDAFAPTIFLTPENIMVIFLGSEQERNIPVAGLIFRQLRLEQLKGR
jgi:hypothetical protein